MRSVEQAIHYVLTKPVSAALLGCDAPAQLEDNVAAARRFTPMAAAEMRRLETLTRPYAQTASYFKDWYRLSRWQRLPYVPLLDRGPKRGT